MSRTRRIAVRAGLVLASTVLTLGAAELVLRLVMPTSSHHLMYQPASDPDLRVELVPGAEFDFEGVTVPIPPSRVTISSQGLRDREHAIPKPAGVKRVLCVGDSTTFGWGVNDDQTFCRRMEQHLPPGWSTVNLGVPGYNTTQEVRRLELVGLAFEPDVVVLLYDGNDVEPPVEYGGRDWLTWLADRSALARWIRRQMIRQGQDQGHHEGNDEGRDQAGPPEPEWDGEAEVRAALRRLAELRREHGFGLLVLTPDPDEGQALFDLLESLQLAHDTIRPVYAEHGPRITIPNDGHPNAEGHRLLAAHIAGLLRKHRLVGSGASPQ